MLHDTRKHNFYAWKKRLQSYIKQPKIWKIQNLNSHNHVVVTLIHFQEILDQSNLLFHSCRALLTYALTKKLNPKYFFASDCKCFNNYYKRVFRKRLIAEIWARESFLTRPWTISYHWSLSTPPKKIRKPLLVWNPLVKWFNNIFWDTVKGYEKLTSWVGWVSYKMNESLSPVYQKKWQQSLQCYSTERENMRVKLEIKTNQYGECDQRYNSNDNLQWWQ